MEDEVLNSKEAAEYLKISKSYLVRMAKEKQIPSMRIGRAYRFTRTSLNQWINERLGSDEEVKLCQK
jgi:excisionase family DNA binding protein